MTPTPARRMAIVTAATAVERRFMEHVFADETRVRRSHEPETVNAKKRCEDFTDLSEIPCPGRFERFATAT
jgi:hypothetical protein